MPEDHYNIAIGRLGIFDFQKGFYVYIGSAKRNIQARINRHITIDKNKHWHIDYLRPYLQITNVHTFSGEECALFQQLLEEHSGTIPAKGFGSSDCQCISHLFYSENEINL
ncbi:GIY-YIG nuclease family protein [Corticicoccus populi]|uniref:DUF123 domain-containing protein n=1 Tax=Corticicoccus populi TaxID=1812821 RepID=A0ABW5WWM5_9STAP